jgi:hypothetical protein
MTEKLHYQTARPLDEVPAYTVGVQLRLHGGPRVYIALSATELVLYFDSNLALHYDLEGRLVKVADTGQFWRRSLSGRVLRTRKEPTGLTREVVPAAHADEIVLDAHRRVAAVHDAFGSATFEAGKPSVHEAAERIQPMLALAAGFNVPIAHRDAELFRAIYGRVAVLPPDQYNAFVVQATEGCAYNGCTFCELYKGVGFRRKSVEEFRQHLRAAMNFHGESLRARRSIFLGEANALTQPTSTLKDIFRVINETVELPAAEASSGEIGANWWLGSKTRFDGVSSFLDVFTNSRRTASDYREFRRAGLRRVYIGLESGDGKLLKWLKKPATPEAALRCVRQLKEADIIVGVIVLLGAGGRERAEAHLRETARVINAMPLGRADFVYFSPLIVYPGSPYDTQAMSEAVTPLTPAEMRQQESELRAALQFDAHHGRPHLAHYELETFVY